MDAGWADAGVLLEVVEVIHAWDPVHRDRVLADALERG